MDGFRIPQQQLAPGAVDDIFDAAAAYVYQLRRDLVRGNGNNRRALRAQRIDKGIEGRTHDLGVHYLLPHAPQNVIQDFRPAQSRGELRHLAVQLGHVDAQTSGAGDAAVRIADRPGAEGQTSEAAFESFQPGGTIPHRRRDTEWVEAAIARDAVGTGDPALREQRGGGLADQPPRRPPKCRVRRDQDEPPPLVGFEREIGCQVDELPPALTAVDQRLLQQVGPRNGAKRRAGGRELCHAAAILNSGRPISGEMDERSVYRTVPATVFFSARCNARSMAEPIQGLLADRRTPMNGAGRSRALL